MRNAKLVSCAVLFSALITGTGLTACTAHAAPGADAAHAPDGSIVATSRIERVTVYPDRAAIERFARHVMLPKGASRILFRDLPSTLFTESVRAEGSADALVTITNVDTKRDHLAPVERPGSDSLRVVLDALGVEQAKLLARKEAHSLAAEFLKSIKAGVQGSGEGEAREPSPQELKNIFELLRTEYGDNQTQVIDLDVELRRVQERMNALERQWREEQSKSAQGRWTVAVEVWAEKPGAMDLTLTYAVRGASWTPTYDVRVSEDLSGIELVYSGSVSQATGEAWDDVAMALSTAEPALGAQVPDLAARWLSLPELAMASAIRSGRIDVESSSSESKDDVKNQFKHRAINAPADALAMEAEGGGGAFPASEAMYIAKQSEMATMGSGVTARFDVPTRQSLAADGTARRMTVASIPLQGEVSYQAVPAIAQNAFLVAKVKNASELPILAGRSQVFLGSQFLGTGWIEEAPPAQSFDLSLGVDKSVSVKRELVRREKRTPSRGSGDERVEYLYRTVIENRKPIPVKIRVRDQVPVSQDHAVAIADERLEPSPNERTKDDGLMAWEFAIAAGGKQAVEIGYVVRYPSGREPIGLAMR